MNFAYSGKHMRVNRMHGIYVYGHIFH